MMDKKRILTFILVAYGISWLIWMPNVVSYHFSESKEINNWLHITGGLGPMLSAFITVLVFDKWMGLKKFFTEKFIKIAKPKYLLIGVGMPILFFLIATFIVRLITGEWVNISDIGLNAKVPITNQLIIWLIWTVFYGIGEETGWRGFLFPEFTKKSKARIATLYTALIWAPWHLPVFFYDKDFMAMGFVGTIGWVVGLIFGSLLLGWLVKKSEWNLWPVILWHGTFNFFTTSDRIDVMFPSLMSMIIILMVIWITKRYGENLNATN